jgi:hypothetical protein
VGLQSDDVVNPGGLRRREAFFGFCGRAGERPLAEDMLDLFEGR